MTTIQPKKRRGRPPKARNNDQDTRALLIRSGLEHLTQSGFVGSGLDKILKQVGVPKGSFYFYFDSKEAFGLAVIESYDSYFANKLDVALLDETYSPLTRLANFVEDAKNGMFRHDFKRGCLVGNLEQEIDALPSSYRQKLIDIYHKWQSRVERCLVQAQQAGELSAEADCQAMAEFFWVGWEGAVSRARLEQSVRPLDHFFTHFSNALPK